MRPASLYIDLVHLLFLVPFSPSLTYMLSHTQIMGPSLHPFLFIVLVCVCVCVCVDVMSWWDGENESAANFPGFLLNARLVNQASTKGEGCPNKVEQIDGQARLCGGLATGRAGLVETYVHTRVQDQESRMKERERERERERVSERWVCALHPACAWSSWADKHRPHAESCRGTL